MIVDTKHKLSGRVKVVDYRGFSIPGVFYFNTKTKRIKMYVPCVKSNGQRGVAVAGTNPFDQTNKTATVSFILKGARLVDTRTGKQIK